MIKFNQKAGSKSYTNMNTKLRQKVKTILRKKNLKLVNNAVFGKTMENVRKHTNIKLAASERKRNYLVSNPNYHTT